jgi:uncharacterized membrane protein
MRTPNPIIAAFITLSVNMSFFLAYALSTGVLSEVRLSRIYLFVISGFMAPGLARLFSYKGLQTVGMSIAAPIINGEILFAVGLAVIFLKEPLEPEIVAGVVSVVAGLVLLGRESGRKYPGSVSVTVRYRYLVYPLLASLCYGTSLFVRKLGLNVWGSPILGVLFTGGTSWVIIACTIVSSKNYTRFRVVSRGSLLYFLMAGCSTCIAWYSCFMLFTWKGIQSSAHCHQRLPADPASQSTILEGCGTNHKARRRRNSSCGGRHCGPLSREVKHWLIASTLPYFLPVPFP